MCITGKRLQNNQRQKYTTSPLTTQQLINCIKYFVFSPSSSHAHYHKVKAISVFQFCTFSFFSLEAIWFLCFHIVHNKKKGAAFPYFFLLLSLPLLCHCPDISLIDCASTHLTPNNSNQALRNCLKQYNDFFILHTLLLLDILTNPGGKSTCSSSSRFLRKRAFPSSKEINFNED